MASIFRSFLLLALAIAALSTHAATMTVNFDDIDASTGDIPIVSFYSGFTWINFTAYTTTPGFPGFNSGIISPVNAAYSGGETSVNAVLPVIGSISATALFDFIGADLGAGYYNGLSLTIQGLRSGQTLYTQTVTLDTLGARTMTFNFVGIDALNFSAAATATSTDPLACGIFNCTQFTLDNLRISAVPEPATSLLILAGIFGIALVALRSQRDLK